MREYLSTGWRALLLAACMVGITIFVSLNLQEVFEMQRADEEDRAIVDFAIINDELVFIRGK